MQSVRMHALLLWPPSSWSPLLAHRPQEPLQRCSTIRPTACTSLAHRSQDGFPAGLARSNGFQRHATLLVYLNSTQEARSQCLATHDCGCRVRWCIVVATDCFGPSTNTIQLGLVPSTSIHVQGGATRFDMLNLAVQPQKGKALLFFPAFADGTSDPRSVCGWCVLSASVACQRTSPGGSAVPALPVGTRCCSIASANCALPHLLPAPAPLRRSLHTAEDAAEGNTKWVTQQWVARGLSGAAADPIQAALSGSLPLGSSSAGTAVPAAQPARRAAAADEGPSAAEALLAGKRGKGKKGDKKKKGGGGGGKGFGA